MNFLLVNDDGVSAPGIWTAARTLAEFGRVLVVAPSLNYSGYGAAFPPATEVSCSPYPSPGVQIAGIAAFSIGAPPAACAQIGLSGVLSKMPIDLVVSGINHGANLGHDVLYSGTVGAAITAVLLGKPAIAISLDAGPAGTAHWDTAAWCLREVIRGLGREPQPDQSLLNVNVPSLPLRSIAGIEVTSLSSTSFLGTYDVRMAQEDRLTIGRKPGSGRPENEPCSDAWALAHGQVSVTPLRIFPDIMLLPGWRHCPEEAMNKPSAPGWMA